MPRGKALKSWGPSPIDIQTLPQSTDFSEFSATKGPSAQSTRWLRIYTERMNCTRPCRRTNLAHWTARVGSGGGRGNGLEYRRHVPRTRLSYRAGLSAAMKETRMPPIRCLSPQSRRAACTGLVRGQAPGSKLAGRAACSAAGPTRSGFQRQVLHHCFHLCHVTEPRPVQVLHLGMRPGPVRLGSDSICSMHSNVVGSAGPLSSASRMDRMIGSWMIASQMFSLQ